MKISVFRKALVIAIIVCFVGMSIVTSLGGVSVKKPGSTETMTFLRNLDSGGNTLYVDDVLKSTDAESPYEWTLDERVFGKHELKVITYDISENKVEDEINVIIFNFGG